MRRLLHQHDPDLALRCALVNPAYNHHALVPRLDKRGFSTGQPLLQGTSRAFHSAIYAAAGYNGITPHGERGEHEGMKAGSYFCSGRNLLVSVVFGLSQTRPWITPDLGLVQFAPCAARNRDFFRAVLPLRALIWPTFLSTALPEAQVTPLWV